MPDDGGNPGLRGLSPIDIAMLTGAPSGNARQQGSGWFGPWSPLTPVAPSEVRGREWDFRPGYNLATRTRVYEGLPFWELKNLARYDVVAMAIETRKDQMARLPWSIVPRTDTTGRPVGKVKGADIESITQFFRRPDKRHAWGTWLRMLCHEQLETDTASIYPHRTNGGDLLALELIDGTTMKPIIDDYGRIPEGPDVAAYQQILRGLPAVDYTADDLIYMPRNPRVGKVYGFSPVEQIFATIGIALRRQEFQRDYFTSGNMPEGLVGLPADWSHEQCRKFADDWNEMVAGRANQRSGRIKFVPGDVGKTYVAFKDPELSGKFDEYLIRHVCYAFSLPPTPFINQVNRATAESAHDAALEEGLAPLQAWAKEWLDFILETYWPDVPVEFAWADDREVDALVQMQTLTGYATKGIRTINEVRDSLGQAPMAGGEELKVLTANGYVPVDAPPPEPAPETGAATDGQPPGDEPPKDGEGAPAAKAAGTFRKGGYWNKANGHVHAPHQSGAAGGKGARKSAA